MATSLDFTVSRDPIDFGTVRVGDSGQLTVGLTNNGTYIFKVGGNMPTPNPGGDVAMSIDSPAAFTVIGLPSKWPRSLGAGDALTFALDFAPTAPGHYAGELEIWLENAPAPIVVPVVGEAT
jgi:hypothetical protein